MKLAVSFLGRAVMVGLLVVPLAASAAPSRFSDDFAGALGSAKARRAPLVVDVWAPW